MLNMIGSFAAQVNAIPDPQARSPFNDLMPGLAGKAVGAFVAVMVLTIIVLYLQQR